MSEITKDDVICPLSWGAANWIQNYRVTYNKSNNMFVSRPQPKDPGYAAFVEKGEKAYYFSPEEGYAAREQARNLMLDGKIKAPANWDVKWNPLADGPSLEELKAKYPELYGKPKKQPSNVNSKFAYKLVQDLQLNAQPQPEDQGVEDLVDKVVAAPELNQEHEKSFAVTAVPNLEETAHQIKVPYQALKPQIHVPTFVFIDESGGTHEFYLVQNQETHQWNAFEVGANKFPSTEVVLTEESS